MGSEPAERQAVDEASYQHHTTTALTGRVLLADTERVRQTHGSEGNLNSVPVSREIGTVSKSALNARPSARTVEMSQPKVA